MIIWYTWEMHHCRTRWIIVHTLHSNTNLYIVTVSIYYYEIQYLLINHYHYYHNNLRLFGRLLIDKVLIPPSWIDICPESWWLELFIMIFRTEWPCINGLSEARHKLSGSLSFFLHSVIQTSQILVTPARKDI